MTVTREFLLRDGTIVSELSPEDFKKFQQRVFDLFTPLAYEAVLQEMQEERKIDREKVAIR